MTEPNGSIVDSIVQGMAEGRPISQEEIGQILQNLQKPVETVSTDRLTPEERKDLVRRFQEGPPKRGRSWRPEGYVRSPGGYESLKHVPAGSREATPLARVPDHQSRRTRQKELPEAVSRWLSDLPNPEATQQFLRGRLPIGAKDFPYSDQNMWWQEKQYPTGFFGALTKSMKDDAIATGIGIGGESIVSDAYRWVSQRLGASASNFTEADLRHFGSEEKALAAQRDSQFYGLGETMRPKTTRAKIGKAFGEALFPGSSVELLEEAAWWRLGGGPAGKLVVKGLFGGLKVLGRGTGKLIVLPEKARQFVINLVGTKTDDVVDMSQKAMDKAERKTANEARKRAQGKAKNVSKTARELIDAFGLQGTAIPSDRALLLPTRDGVVKAIFLEAGPGMPRTAAEIATSKRVLPAIGKVGLFPENFADDLIQAAVNPNPGIGEKTFNVVSSLPVFKKVLRTGRTVLGAHTWGSTADDFILRARLLKGQLSDMAEAFTRIATDTAELLRTKQATLIGGKLNLENLGIIDDILPVYGTGRNRGFIIRRDIQQIKPLPGQTRINRARITTYDLVSYAERYNMPDDVRGFVHEVRSVARDTVAMLKREGITFARKMAETDFQYLHRYLTNFQREVLDDTADEVKDILLKKGIVTRWAKRTKDTPFNYVRKFLENVQSGNIKNDKEIKALAARIARDLFVEVETQSITKRSKYQTVLDALANGHDFDHNVVRALRSQVQLSYRMVINQRVNEFLSKAMTSQDEIVQATVKQTEEATRNVKNLLKVVQKALSGEKFNRKFPSQRITAQEMKAFTALYPKEAAQFRQILEIQPADVNSVIKKLAQELRFELKKTPAMFAQALEMVRIKSFPRRLRMPKPPAKRPVTNEELRETLRRLGADQKTTITFLERIYQETVSYPARGRKAALEDFGERLKTLIRKSERAHRIAKDHLQEQRNTLTYLMETKGTARVPKGIMPGFYKNDMFVTTEKVTQFFDGKEVTGTQFVAMLEKEFGKGVVTDGFLRQMAGFAGIYRLMRASLDLSFLFIQGTAILGIDFHNLLFKTVPYASKVFLKEAVGVPMIVGTKPPPSTFFGAAKSMFTAVIDPRYELKWWTNPARKASAIRRALHGGIIQSSEWTEGQAALKNLVDWPGLGPVNLRNRVGKFIKGGITQFYGRADAAWSAGRNAMAQLYWESMENVVPTSQLGNLARATNLLSGAFSFRGVGMPTNQQNLLTAFVFFAPRFTYAQTALVSHIFRGGVSGTAARKAVLGMTMLNTMVFTLASMALGQDPKINPLPKSMGGDGSDVWTIRIGNRRYGIGGLLYSPMRLISEIVGTMDDPDDILSTELLLSTNNPVLRWWRGKQAGPTQLVWNYFDGSNAFTGEDMRSLNISLPGAGPVASFTKEGILPSWTMMRWVFPIWSDVIGEKDSGMYPIGAEIGGFRTRPESLWSQMARMVEDTDGRNRRYSEIGFIDKKLIIARNPEIKAIDDQAREEAKKRGWSNEKTGYYAERSAANDEFNELLLDIQDEYISAGKFDLQIDDVREQILTAKRTYSDRLRRIDAKYPEVIAEFESERLRDLEAGEPAGAYDAAYREYLHIIHDPNNWDAARTRPKKSLSQQMDDWEEKTPEGVRAQIEEYKAVSIAERPWIYIKYMESQKALQTWWQVYDDFEKEFPDFVIAEAKVEEAKKRHGVRGMGIEERKIRDTPINGKGYDWYTSRRFGLLADELIYSKPAGLIDAVLEMWGYRKVSTNNGQRRLFGLSETWEDDWNELMKYQEAKKTRFQVGVEFGQKSREN